MNRMRKVYVVVPKNNDPNIASFYYQEYQHSYAFVVITWWSRDKSIYCKTVGTTYNISFIYRLANISSIKLLTKCIINTQITFENK